MTTSGSHAADAEEPRIDLCHVAFGGLGGHGAIVRLLADQLARKGRRSAVILHAPAADIDADPAHWPHLDQVVAVPRAGKVDLAAMLAVVRCIRRMRPLVVLCHTHESVPAVYLGQLLGRCRPRVVLVEHQSVGLRRNLENLRSLIALPFCRTLVVLSDDYRDRYPLRRVPVRAVRTMRVIPNGIDTRRLQPAPRPSRARPFTLGMGCRLVSIKDVDTLIEATALAARNGCDVRLRLAGDGPTRPLLEAQVDRLGLRGRVEFAGHLDEAEMVDFYGSLDVYVQATLGETASVSLLEASACGLAVIASDVEGVRGCVHHDVDGLLVPPKDPPAMADAIIRLGSDPDLVARLGGTARHRVETDFSAAAMADRYLALLAALGA